MNAATQPLSRRRWLCRLLGAPAALSCGTARAQGGEPFPQRPISLWVPWPAGGATDHTMRLLAELAGRRLGQPGFVVAMVLLLALLVLARWKARHEVMEGVKRTPWPTLGKLLLFAAPALVLPFLIRSAVGEGVATATEVSTIAVLYALVIGKFLYGGLSARQVYRMLVETASLSGAILLILGTASGMAWAIAQSGVVQQLSAFLTTLPGNSWAYLAVTVVVFMILGCVLEGLPAILLLAPIMFPIAKKLGIHDIHYSMVVVTAMNIGLMMPPEDSAFKRPFSFPVAPRTRRPTRLSRCLKVAEVRWRSVER